MGADHCSGSGLWGTLAWIVVPCWQLRFDGESSIQEFQTLLHADEAKPSARLCGFDIKAHARIGDREVHLIRCSP